MIKFQEFFYLLIGRDTIAEKANEASVCAFSFMNGVLLALDDIETRNNGILKHLFKEKIHNNSYDKFIDVVNKLFGQSTQGISSRSDISTFIQSTNLTQAYNYALNYKGHSTEGAEFNRNWDKVNKKSKKEPQSPRKTKIVDEVDHRSEN